MTEQTTVNLLELFDRMRELEKTIERLRDENARYAAEHDKMLEILPEGGGPAFNRVLKRLEVRVTTLAALRYSQNELTYRLADELRTKLINEVLRTRHGMRQDHATGDMVFTFHYWSP